MVKGLSGQSLTKIKPQYLSKDYYALLNDIFTLGIYSVVFSRHRVSYNMITT